MMDFIKAVQGSEAIYRLGWTLLHTLWLGTAVAVLFITAMLILQRRSANGRYLVGCIAMVLMVALPVAAFFMVPAPAEPLPSPTDNAGVLSAAQLTKTPIAVVPEPMVQLPAPAAANPSVQGDITVETAKDPAALPPPKLPFLTRASRALEPALPWAVLAWAIGVFLLSIWQLASWIAVRRLERLATQPGDKDLIATIARLTRKMRVSRPVRLLESVLVKVPTVVGWLRPVILLPAGLATGLASEQLEAILAHELAHIRRHDYLVNLLQSLVETLLFYHPAVWFISMRIRAERENCCDDIVVAAGAERFSYAESLLHVAQRSAAGQTRRRTGRSAAVAATGRPSQLRSRIGRLLRGRDETATRLGRSWPVALTFLAAILVTTALFVNLRAEPASFAEKPTRPATQPATSTSPGRPAEAESGWSAPVDGLRARLKEPRAFLPLAAAAKGPTVEAVIENCSKAAILWFCSSKTTRMIVGMPGAPGGHGWAMPKFTVTLGTGARPATADEVRKEFSVGMKVNGRDVTGDLPVPGCYHLAPGGRLILTARLLSKPTKPGRYQVDCRLNRHPMHSSTYVQPFLECPPIVLGVVRKGELRPPEGDPEPTTWSAGPWGPSIEGMQVRLSGGFLNPGKVPSLGLDARNFGTRNMRLTLTPAHVEVEMDGVWYSAKQPGRGPGKVLLFGPGNRWQSIGWSPHTQYRWKSKAGKPLTFGPGQHTIRLAVTVRPPAGRLGMPIRLVTNAFKLRPAGAASERR